MLFVAALSVGWSLPSHPRTPLAVSTATRAQAPSAAQPSEPEQFPQTIAEWRDWTARAREDPQAVLALVKDAGLAGAISYTVVELSFFAIALPVGVFAWHASTGEWLQPLLLFREDGFEGKARILGLLLSYIVLLKTLFPLRLGSTLLLTPRTARLLRRIGVDNE
jgi:hypothetical protein